MTAALLAFGFPAAVWLGLVRYADRHEPEPLWLHMLSLLAGTLAALAAGALAALFGVPNSLFSGALATAFTEESLKAVAVLLFVPFRAFNEVFDGLVYGAGVGLGFAVAENVAYAAGDGLVVASIRALTTYPMHVLTAAFSGAAIGRAAFNEAGWRPVFAAVAVSVSAHAAFNAADLYGNVLGAFAVVAGLLAWYFRAADRTLSVEVEPARSDADAEIR